jgi:hypothetical protein
MQAANLTKEKVRTGEIRFAAVDADWISGISSWVLGG